MYEVPMGGRRRNLMPQDSPNLGSPPQVGRKLSAAPTRVQRVVRPFARLESVNESRVCGARASALHE